MKKRYAIVFVAMALLILLALLWTDAVMALMLEMTTPELTKQAEAIVRGKVKDMNSEWDPERRFIWTLVTISVSKSIKGDILEGQDVIVKIPGGVVGQIGQKTEDAPIFKKGEDVLLFLKPEVYRGEKFFGLPVTSKGNTPLKTTWSLRKKCRWQPSWAK